MGSARLGRGGRTAWGPCVRGAWWGGGQHEGVGMPGSSKKLHAMHTNCEMMKSQAPGISNKSNKCHPSLLDMKLEMADRGPFPASPALKRLRMYVCTYNLIEAD